MWHERLVWADALRKSASTSQNFLLYLCLCYWNARVGFTEYTNVLVHVCIVLWCHLHVLAKRRVTVAFHHVTPSCLWQVMGELGERNNLQVICTCSVPDDLLINLCHATASRFSIACIQRVFGKQPRLYMYIRCNTFCTYTSVAIHFVHTHTHTHCVRG